MRSFDAVKTDVNDFWTIYKQCELISPTFKLLFCRICFKIIIFCCSSVFEFDHSLSTAFAIQTASTKPNKLFCRFSLQHSRKKNNWPIKSYLPKGARKLCKVRILCHMRIHALLCRKKAMDKNKRHALLRVNGQRVQANEIKCWGRSVRR